MSKYTRKEQGQRRQESRNKKKPIPEGRPQPKKTKITSVKNTALENNEEAKKFQFIPHKREN